MTSPSHPVTMEPPLKKQRTSFDSFPPSSTTNDNDSVTATQPTSNPEQNTNTTTAMDNPMLPPATRVVISDTGFQPEKEITVGITHFVNSDNPGFQGVLKQRYTDFLVNEIMPDGTVAHLTNDKPIDPRTFQKPDQKPEPAAQEPTQPAVKDGKENVTIETVALTATNGNANKDNDTQSTQAATAPEPTPVADKAEGEDSTSAQTSETQVENFHALTDITNNSSGNAAAPAFVIQPEDEEYLATHLGADIKDRILRLHAETLARPTARPASFDTVTTAPFTNRALRGTIHQKMKEIFNLKLDTSTNSDGAIDVYCHDKSRQWNSAPQQTQKSNPRQQQPRSQPTGKLGWNERGGQYLHFSLYKENKDTMEIIVGLAKSLHIKPKDFNFAGTKDRRAVTVQRVSVFRQLDTTMVKLNRDLWGNASIGNYKFEKNPLELGELNGNQFHITLRDCHFGDDAGLDVEARLERGKKVVGEAVKHLQEHGFLNYFGLQRFGTFGIGTDEIGVKLLQGAFQAAVDAILAYNESALAPNGSDPTDRASRDDRDRAQAIQNFRNGRPGHEVLQLMPRKFSGESAIIRHLSQNNRSTDFSGAIMTIHRNLRTMYVHAYQSLVWNFVASERWIRYGSKVIAGDLVLVASKHATEVQDEVDESGEVVVHAAVDDSALTRDDVYERARPLTAEEAESGQFNIFDIVLPLPGFDVEYPQNDIGDFYKEFMGSERGGGLDPANMRRNIKDFSLSGSYRKLMAGLGGDCTYELKLYKDEMDQLVETDLEKLRVSQGKPARPAPFNHNNRQNNHNNGQDNQRGNSGGRGGRGGRGNRGGRGGWGNNSRYPDQTEQIAHAKARHANNPNLALWANAGNTIPAEEKKEFAAYELEKSTRVSSNQPLVTPVIKETWIQTNPDDFTKRTGVKTKKIIADEEVDLPLSEKDPKSPSSKTEVSVASDPSEAAPKRPADEISTAPPSPALTTASTKNEVVKKEPEQLIAVIVKFALGSSQYATMALRELMKAGGVKTYKPDFSGGR